MELSEEMAEGRDEGEANSAKDDGGIVALGEADRADGMRLRGG